MRLTIEDMIAPSNSSFDLRNIRKEEEQNLQDMLEQLKVGLSVIEKRVRQISAMLLRRHSEGNCLPCSSYVQIHPEYALETLQLPQEAEYVLGRRGLGIRTIHQLTQYPRPFLKDQIEQYDRRADVDQDAPMVRPGDIDHWLDAVEAKLAMKGLKLAT